MTRFFVLLMVTMLSSPVHAQSLGVNPQGEFAEVDTSVDIKAVEKLLKKRKSQVKKVLAEPNDFSPPVLYALSYALFERDRKDEAAFWFYAGQLRASSDAEKSLDASAGQAVAVLNQQFGTPINQYMITDIPALRTTVERVVQWDRENQRNYDPRWIALHGMDAFTESTIAFEPAEEWDRINEETRVKYREDFLAAIEEFGLGAAAQQQ
ncbi:hypothetical protein F3N42_15025 [Marinihelvus fidelis]|uniref:Uncharacterized protein n=1 Tax=Marinihelvus fidelis TaxID=2613842 RepID=A0A5N0T3M7_9GAMM|nr:hypothetical protein [Marinihelvus fidelis]KAA9129675.1 hypothetical protein F3N42_15025 [Marinihelvus fidelis]